ncbi:MAG: PhoH family protein [Proteobacteria bacterium]|nr:PhoH family protein [SAR324 cluster bacterium]RZO44320.1 MAG: PhoH family protein [Pseudomonadota bacterium]HJL94936.1 PhoH family protein [SAR324 cluster bacterium]
MNHPSVYVLDISVLLYTPDAIFDFPMKEVLLPVSILDALEPLRQDLGEKGRVANLVSKILDECRQLGNLVEGVSLPNGGKLRIELADPETEAIPFSFNSRNPSNRILAVAWLLSRENKDVVFVSRDENLRTKANTLNVPTISYQGRRRDDSNLYSGIHHCEVSKKKLRNLNQQSFISIEEVKSELDENIKFFPNQGLLLNNPEVPEEDVLAIYNQSKNKFLTVSKEQGVWGIRPRNLEQRLALALLVDPNISIVTLSGKAGTGKTLLALAVGLQQMMVDNIYSRMLVSRPIFPMGRDLGFLPGDTQEKLSPWMQPIFDNLELLINNTSEKKSSKRDSYQELMERGMLVVEPLTYIRGRSIPNQHMIVDEAQNLTPHEMKTIVSRAGDGTKIVLTGDPNQIDNTDVNLSSNGLSTLVERFKGSQLAGHVRFTSVERSALAELAANVL